ncbi:glycoside hydrolase family 16 protein [Deinococcus arcticus]|uniref:glycoside hydrolase family 16 protein n=1 Tax=Deinococcus arcticus TaxID=2136176 RepID=UPI001304B277|nr:glycoside hydrolase family 16 protein [Deinococcus arcticus]
MNSVLPRLTLVLGLTACGAQVPHLGQQAARVVQPQAATLNFSGFTWTVKEGSGLGPGPNTWSARNVWLDAAGDLHLAIRRDGSTWTNAEVSTGRRLGYGTYEWRVIGRVDQLDQNVVLGLFQYPTPDTVPAGQDPDGLFEIDVELARWGQASAQPLNYTTYPSARGQPVTSRVLPLQLQGTYTTHRYTRLRDRVIHETFGGHTTARSNRMGCNEFVWPATYNPSTGGWTNPRIAQIEMPVHMNLWLFRGMAPANGQETEVTVRRFQYAPSDGSVNAGTPRC